MNRATHRGHGARDAVFLGLFALLALTIRFDFDPPATDLGSAMAANEASVIPFERPAAAAKPARPVTKLAADGCSHADSPAPPVRPAVLARRVEREIEIEGPVEVERLLRLVTHEAASALRVVHVTVDEDSGVIVISIDGSEACSTDADADADDADDDVLRLHC